MHCERTSAPLGKNYSRASQSLIATGIVLVGTFGISTRPLRLAEYNFYCFISVASLHAYKYSHEFPSVPFRNHGADVSAMYTHVRSCTFLGMRPAGMMQYRHEHTERLSIGTI